MSRVLILVAAASLLAVSVLAVKPSTKPQMSPTPGAATCSFITVQGSVDANLASEGVKKCGSPLPCISYQSPQSCLGTLGPIGSLGPLGALGPLGTALWNPSAWMSAIGNWQDWSAAIIAKTSMPLSSAGPLGPRGLSTLQSLNDFGVHLMPFGVWAVLGPAGPLGALGPLGPLGPMGIHGFSRDANGNYLDTAKKVVHKVTYAWDGTTKREWELYEEYTSAKAAKSVVGGLDTSFFVTANLAVGLGYAQTPDSYTVTSATAQYVTILVVPENTFDAFGFVVSTGAGKKIVDSSSTTYINWVQLYVPAGTQLRIAVSLKLTGRVSPFGFVYRLYVTGSSTVFGPTTLGRARTLPCPASK